LPLEWLWSFAERALDGVGDPALGEWREVGERAVHLRRRLSDKEARQVGPVVDVRGKDDGYRRAEKAWRACPATRGIYS
jgi:hypothetical protein